MRYRVDLPYGYASFSEEDYDLAVRLYEQDGIRLLRTKNLNDEEGELIKGVPLSVNFKYNSEMGVLN